jgi:hypothetical protein
MEIRTYGPGDDVAQVSIYNEAAGDLPCFKPANLDEVRRRTRAEDFDPSSRFVAVVNGRPAAYIQVQTNGRISYPWCRKGQESLTTPLLEHTLRAMKARGLQRAFTAYRDDWPAQREFFQRHGFQVRRYMVNFALDLVDMPTPMARPNTGITPATPADIPAILEMGAGVLSLQESAALERYLFHNPYFPADAAFVLRARADGSPQAVGILIANPAYAAVSQVNPGMPCFRLGAFGTEGMTTKRINGLFSFLAANTNDLNPFALDLMSYAAYQLRDTEVETFAAQVPSDADHLLRFYKRFFQQQARFPILERAL